MKKQNNEPEQFRDATPKEIREAIKENMSRILANAKRIMLDKRINQKELSLRINSDESHVSRMFRNVYEKNGLTINVLTRISKALNVSLKELVQ